MRVDTGWVLIVLYNINRVVQAIKLTVGLKMDEKQLTRDIDTITKNIRRKYSALKRGIRQSDELLTKTYEPLLTPLTKISEKLSVKEEKKDEIKKEEIPPLTPPRFVRTEVLTETPDVTPQDIEDFLSTPEGRHDAQEYVEQMVEGPLARKYLLLAVSDERERLMDHTYGVRNVQDKWMVGNSVLDINQDDSINIAGKVYRGTPGLYELLFMKNPNKNVYNEEDLAAYKTILSDTNAHKLYYLPGTKINTNRGMKYKEIIARLFPPRIGRGYIDYVHWNDPNELVNRLRLLIGSKRAGHTGHDNEILSIVEELREAGIIY